MMGNLSASDTNFCHLSALLLMISLSSSQPCSLTLSWPQSSSWSLPSSSLSSLQEKQVGNGGQLILLPNQLLPSNDHCRLSQCHRQRHCHRHCYCHCHRNCHLPHCHLCKGRERQLIFLLHQLLPSNDHHHLSAIILIIIIMMNITIITTILQPSCPLMILIPNTIISCNSHILVFN